MRTSLLVMLCSLFTPFDPSSLSYGSVNWVSFLVPLLILVNWQLFISPWNGLLDQFFNFLFGYLGATSVEMFAILVSVFCFLFIWTSSGLFPYSFTPSAHLAVTLSLSAPLWISGVMNDLCNKGIYLFPSSLLPSGSPFVLWPFLVVVESIGMIIRPITLAVRLMANVVSGHLILSLIQGVNGFTFTPLLSFMVSFEAVICLVQSCVFVSLLALYWNE